MPSSSILKAAIYGVRLAYAEKKPTANPVKSVQKPTIIFLHGWCSSHDSFKEQMDFFSQDYHCIALDLPGHGKSAKPHLDYTLVVMGELVSGFIEKLELKSVVLVGHGLGACVALETARQNPNRIKALSFVNPGPIAQSADGNRELNSFQEQMEQKGFEKFIQHAIKINFSEKGSFKQYLEWAVKVSSQVPDYVGKSCFDDLFDWSGRPALKSLRHKPLGLILTNDPIDPVEEFARLNDSFSWGRTMTQSPYGHLTMPEETNALLSSWLRRAVA